MSNQLDLKSLLGASDEELRELVVKSCVDRLLGKNWKPTKIHEKLEAVIAERADALMGQAIEEHILPRCDKLLDNVHLQPTNQWGEKKGDSQTFREYLVKRLDEWLDEPVTYDGKKPDTYSRGTQKRVAHMIHQHFHYEIHNTVKDIVGEAHAVIRDGIQETVALKLGEITKALRVSVRTRD